MVLQADGKTTNDYAPWQENYMPFTLNLISFMKVQALGFPSRNHALFTRYNIEAVTLSGIVKEGEIMIDKTKIGSYSSI